MKRIIDVPEEGVNACKLWVEMGVASWQDTVIANSIPYEQKAEVYPINQEENCKIVREFLRDIANIKDLPLCKECRTCIHCMLGKKKLPKIVWMNDKPFIFCARHHEHFAPDATCEFWKGGAEE